MSANETSPTPFRKRLRWLIQNPPEHSVVATITPADAEEVMRLNASESYQNRPLSAPTRERYIRAMKAGWRLTGETIIISKSGDLLNGQHRLEACIKSGCSFRCHVVFGIDDDAFAYMDIGRKRSAGDIFAINGVANSAAMAAATIWLYRYLNTGMLKPSPISWPTNDQLYELYLHHEGLQKSLRAGYRFAEHKLAPPSPMIALHYLCSEKNRQEADRFFERVATGIGFTSQAQPEAKLRKRLVDSKIGANAIPDLYIAAFTVQTWNAVRLKKPVGLYRWRGEQNPDQPFPRIV